MGEVFRAFDPRLGRPVAVKRVRGDSAAESARQRLQREARAAAGLSHPSIVQVHDILQQEDDDWIVMEWVDGPSLRQLIASGPLPPEQVVKLGLDIAEGLAAAHGHDILHRDLKTENVLLAPDGRAKILDFGLAKQLHGDEGTQLTESGRLLGTCRSMSPEQARGFEVDGRSDLFSLGVLLYELATGTSPFRSQTIAETLVKVCSHAPPSVQTLNDAMPPGLASLIEDLLEKAPQRRPGDALEAARRLRCLRRNLEDADGDFEKEGDRRSKTEADLAAQATWFSETVIEGPWRQRTRSQDRVEDPDQTDSDETAQSDSQTDSITGSYADATRLLRTPSVRRAGIRGLGLLGALILLIPVAQPSFLEEVVRRLIPAQDTSALMRPLPQTPDAESTRSMESEIPRLVVLPFESLGPPDNRYLAAGISEEITQRLASLGGLGVVSRTSARHAVEGGWTVQEIGRQLGVDFLLEGMVNSPPLSVEDQPIRITLRLVWVEDDSPIWTQTYDRLPNDLLDLQSEIAGGLVERLDVALRQPEEAALALALTTEPDAYFAYLRGLDYKNQPGYSEEHMTRAVQMFQQAVDVDPAFVEAQAELSRMHSHIYFNFDASPERRQQARRALDVAVTLGEGRWSAHMAQAFFSYRVESDYAAALEAFGKAAKLSPHHVDVLQGISFVRRRQGRLEDSVALLIRAFSLDRGNATLAKRIAMTHKNMRDFASAEFWFEQALKLAPDQPGSTAHQAANYLNWKGCPRPLDPSVPCSTDGARALLEASPNLGHAKTYQVEIYFDLVDAARLPKEQAAPILDRALERMRASRGPSREWYIRVSTFWREIQLLEMVGMYEQARQEVEQFRQETEALMTTEDGFGLELLDQGSTVTLNLQAAHLGLVYAYLGDSERAIQFGERAAELADRDLYSGPTMQKLLALTYLRCGLHDLATDQVAILLSSYAKHPLTTTELALDPLWQELWDTSRFQDVLRMGQLTRSVESGRMNV